MSETEQYNKYRIMCVAVTMGTLICLLFTVLIRYISQSGKIMQVEWDMATVTVADFAVEFPIKVDSYQRWYQHEYKRIGGAFENGVPPAFALKNDLIGVIEKNLTEDLNHRDNSDDFVNQMIAPALKKRGTLKIRKNKAKEIKVADITFAFDNQELISLLR